MANKEPDTTPLLDLFLLAVFIFALAQKGEIVRQNELLNNIHFTTAYFWRNTMFQEKSKGKVVKVANIENIPTDTIIAKLQKLTPKGKTHIIKAKFADVPKEKAFKDLCHEKKFPLIYSRVFVLFVNKNGTVDFNLKQYNYPKELILPEGFEKACKYQKNATTNYSEFVILLDKDVSPEIRAQAEKYISEYKDKEKITLLTIEESE